MAKLIHQPNLLLTAAILITCVLCFALAYMLPSSETADVVPTKANSASTTVSASSTTPTTTFPATYISSKSWPPVITTVDEEDTSPCLTATNDGPFTETTLMTVDTATYCKTTTSEGAAGSTYTTYTYQSIILPVKFTEFVLRYTNCGNYEELEQTTCTNERNSFNIDLLVHQIFTGNN